MTNAEIFNEYYESIKENYPHLTRDQIKETCMFPWKLMNKKMKEPNLPSIRLKYFGQWVVKEGRVRHLKGLLDGRKDRMFEQTYLEQKETYETYLKMKYEDLLEQFGFKEFKEKASTNLALDHGDELVYVAPTRVNLQMTQERFPDVVFHSTREHGVRLGE